MKICDTPAFPNPAGVRIALAEKGATDQVCFVAVNVMGGEHRSPAFRAKNPDAAVPCLDLADQPFLAGNAFSWADITAFADFAKVDIPASVADLAAWQAKVAARPSIAG